MPSRKAKAHSLTVHLFRAATLADEMDLHLANGAEAGALIWGIYEDLKNTELEENRAKEA